MIGVVEQHTRSKYIPALDGVRFLAVALVMLHHLTRGSQTSIVLHLIGLQVGNGLGPPLFFVLSGVLLMSASSALRGIVATKGNDVGLLMRAFDRMSIVMTLLMAAFTIATVAWLGLYVFYTRGG